MFTATFIISFGIKKGNISAYASYWYADFQKNLQLLNYSTLSLNSLKGYQNLLLYRFQFTSITSRQTQIQEYSSLEELWMANLSQNALYKRKTLDWDQKGLR
jgi:hypothetical protein